LGLLLIGAIVGYLAIDLWKNIKFLLETNSFILFLAVAGIIYLVGKSSPTRFPADVIAGFGIGLALRSSSA